MYCCREKNRDKTSLLNSFMAENKTMDVDKHMFASRPPAFLGLGQA